VDNIYIGIKSSGYHMKLIIQRKLQQFLNEVKVKEDPIYGITARRK
jgi:hypothetical protein